MEEDNESLFGVEMTHLQIVVVKLLVVVLLASLVNELVIKVTAGFSKGARSFVQGIVNLALMAGLIWYFKIAISS